MSRPDGARIRERRRRKGLTVRALAERAGIAEKTLRRLERNSVETPHPETIRAVAGALEVDPESLFEPERPAGPDANSAPEPELLRGLDVRSVPGFSGRPPIAALRFENLSNDPDQQYFADGLVEDLVARLSAWRVLPVIATTSSFEAGLESRPLEEIRARLGARYLVRGSVRRSNGQIRISVKLVDAVNGHQIWAQSFDRHLTDVLLLQDEVSAEIMGRLGAELSTFESRRAIELDDSALQAWDICVRGWWHVRKITLRDTQRALELFERAVAIDPNLALAWVGRAQARVDERRFLGASLPSLQQAREWAERAVQCDPRLAVGHTVLATIRLNLGDLAGASDAIERAIELDPCSPFACLGRAAGLMFMGRPQDALEHVLRAVRLDPCSPNVPDYLRYVGICYLSMDRHDEAARCFERSIQRRPDIEISYWDLAVAYGLAGRLHEAKELRDQMQAAIAEPNKARSWIQSSVVWPSGLRERYVEGLRAAGWELSPS